MSYKLLFLLTMTGVAAAGCARNADDAAAVADAATTSPGEGTAEADAGDRGLGGPLADAGSIGDPADDDGGASPADADAGEPLASADGGAGAVGDAGTEAPTAALPAEVLDLAGWKLTLPTGSGTKPAEVLQPQLSRFALAPWFRVGEAGRAVAFRAHCGGVTTSNSGYPRSELREMSGAGSTQASWSTASGTHTMTITQAITHLPQVKPHVVAGQIHDASDDVIMIRLEGRHLFVEGGGVELADLDASYELGRVFTVKIEAGAGRIRVWYDGVQKLDMSRVASGCYFKAGCYTQSNTSKGDAADAYGEVEVYALDVVHQP